MKFIWPFPYICKSSQASNHGTMKRCQAMESFSDNTMATLSHDKAAERMNLWGHFFYLSMQMTGLFSQHAFMKGLKKSLSQHPEVDFQTGDKEMDARH